MPFLQDVNHTALVKSFREYPNELKIVRFNIRQNIPRPQEENPTAYGVKENCYNRTSPVQYANGLTLTKTFVWSDKYVYTYSSHLMRGFWGALPILYLIYETYFF